MTVRASNEAENAAQAERSKASKRERSPDADAMADAYEELARIDSLLRQDYAAALGNYEAAARSAPGRTWVLRILERAYAADGRFAELSELRQLQAEAQDPDTLDGPALLLDRAALLEKAGASNDQVLDEYRAIYIHK